MDTVDTLIEEAWRQCYLDPKRASALGHQIVAAGRPDVGWFHVALAAARSGDDEDALASQAQAREAYAAMGDITGVALCDEVLAMCHRHRGDLDACTKLQWDLDHRQGVQYAPLQSFIAHNSRAFTAKLVGDVDGALQRFYAALDSARRCGLPGPEVTALGNLGGYHLGLFNNQDARMLCEQALQRATEIGAGRSKLNALANLMIAAHTESRHQDALALAKRLADCARALPPDAVTPYESSLAMARIGVGDIDAAMEHLERSALALPADRVVRQAWLHARCLLARNDAAGAQRVTADALAGPLLGMPYDVVALHRAAADASEALGDMRSALDYTRLAQQLYEQMIGRSLRASHVAQRVEFELEVARGQRSTAELNLQRMAETNRALQASIAETQLLHAQLRELALRDTLTGLHNRRYLYEAGPGLIELARRSGEPLCVALLDLDHFKALNDTHGHEAGDLVLQRFAKVLTQELRRSDVICRYGGEEFVVVMPDIDADAALSTLDRLLAAFRIEAQSAANKRLPVCAFSAGLALFPVHGEGLPQLLARADAALYKAKDAGRARSERAATDFSELS